MRGMKILVVIGLAAHLSWLWSSAVWAQPNAGGNYRITLRCRGSAVETIALEFFNNGQSITLIVFAFVNGPECDPNGQDSKVYLVKDSWDEMRVIYSSLQNGKRPLGGKVESNQLRIKGVRLGQEYCLNPTTQQRQVHGEVLPCPGPDNKPSIQIDAADKVPSTTEWGLLALAVLLAGSLAFMIRRRLAPRPARA